MLVDPSSAIIAKARVKYGRRLTNKDYHTLVRLSNVTEVVSYLKSHTYYAGLLKKVPTTDVHRGMVEQQLREALFDSFLSLCRYISSDSPITKYIIRQREINEINKYLTLLSIGKPEEYIFSLPLYFTEHTDIYLDKMSKARNYDEFLSSLGSTNYRKILREFSGGDNGRIDIPAVEDALEIYSLKELYTSIDKIRNNNEKKELSALFDTIVDYNNFARVFRLKQYYHMNNDELRTHLLPYGHLSGKTLDSILSSESFDDIYAGLQNTTTGKKIMNKDFDIDGEVSIRGKHDICRHNLYFSSNPETVLISYYLICETELNNVINIIEGVRYSLDPGSITKMLIY